MDVCTGKCKLTKSVARAHHVILLFSNCSRLFMLCAKVSVVIVQLNIEILLFYTIL